jgi:hypothetical protein
MPRVKRLISSSMVVDGQTLVWKLHREQQLNTEDGWKGICIHVSVEGGRVCKDLHLEYPTYVPDRLGLKMPPPFRPTILKAKVEAHILQAIEAGWVPGSRGKPYVHELDELPC